MIDLAVKGLLSMTDLLHFALTTLCFGGGEVKRSVLNMNAIVRAKRSILNINAIVRANHSIHV